MKQNGVVEKFQVSNFVHLGFSFEDEVEEMKQESQASSKFPKGDFWRGGGSLFCLIFPPELINNPLTCKQGTETTPSSPGGRCEGGAEPLPPLWPLGCYPGMICIICVCVCVCVCMYTIFLDPRSI